MVNLSFIALKVAYDYSCQVHTTIKHEIPFLQPTSLTKMIVGGTLLAVHGASNKSLYLHG